MVLGLWLKVAGTQMANRIINYHASILLTGKLPIYCTTQVMIV